MLMISDSMKQAYNQYTTQRKSYIQVGENSFFIQNLNIEADCYNEGNIIGNAISKIAKFDIETEYVSQLDEFELFDGIWTGEQYEYVSLGTFKLFNEEGADDFFSSITAYDKLINFNKEYDPNMVVFPTTIYDFLVSICSQAGVELENTSIPNGSKVLDSNLFVENETLKVILNAICQISGNYGIISNNKLKLLLRGTERITLNKSQISNPEYKRTTWKINQVVLGMTNIDGEYVTRRDEDDIALNGEHKIVINDNPFVYAQDLREVYIDELFEQIKGFGYVAFETTWEGLPYVEIGDLADVDGKESIVLRYNLKSPDGLNSTLSAPSIIDSVVKYVDNSNSIANRVKITEYKVNKQEGKIELLTSDIKNVTDLSNNNYTKEEINQLIQTAQTGLTNTFSQSGGNNIFRNTGLWFENSYEEAQENPYEFWQGKVERKRNDESSSKNSMLLQEGTLIQEQEVVNGIYTVSFVYKKLIELANISVFINDVEYELTQLEKTEFCTGQKNSDEDYIVYPLEVSSNHITIKFVSDTDNALEVWDLMVNKGSEKVVWTQNENETTTDTVNISKGISITSSDLDVQFKANADGIRTLDKNGNELTKFTDKGMTTKEAVVENEANIVGILRQRVDGQIWDSFIG